MSGRFVVFSMSEGLALVNGAAASRPGDQAGRAQLQNGHWSLVSMSRTPQNFSRLTDSNFIPIFGDSAKVF